MESKMCLIMIDIKCIQYTKRVFACLKTVHARKMCDLRDMLFTIATLIL